MENASSEQELLELRNEGKISEDEYKQLLEAMRKSPASDSRQQGKQRRKYRRLAIFISIAVIAGLLLVFGVVLGGLYGDIDLTIAKDGFTIQPYSDTGLYSLVASIVNRGDRDSPAFRVKFYRGEPANDLNEKGEPQRGSHGAGPIKAGASWGEGTLPFALKEGVNEFYVVLDIEETVNEKDETNNTAMLTVTVQDGRITTRTFSFPKEK